MLYSTPIFWISLVMFIISQLLEANGIFIPWVHSYLDDILCSPIVLGFALFMQQQFTYRNPKYVLTKGMIVLFVAWYSLIFEVLLPLKASRFHSDFFDVIAYSIGAYLYYVYGNKPVSRLLFPKANRYSS